MELLILVLVVGLFYGAIGLVLFIAKTDQDFENNRNRGNQNTSQQQTDLSVKVNWNSSQTVYASSSFEEESSLTDATTISRATTPEPQQNVLIIRQDTPKPEPITELLKLGSLIDLYSKKSLSEGMYLIASTIEKDNLCCLDEDTDELYKDKINSWMEENSYLYQEKLAIDSKRRGNYDYALFLYDGFFEAKPWFPQTHYNAFKTLAAARQFNEAYRAIQLWCLAIIPHAVFQHPDSMRLILNQTNILDVKQNLGLCNSLYLWSSSIPDAMYHLGNMGMLVSGLLSPLRVSTYIESLSGGESLINFQQMEEARPYGLDLVYELPWMSISDVLGGRCWSEIFTATQEVAKRVGRDSFRPPAS